MRRHEWKSRLLLLLCAGALLLAGVVSCPDLVRSLVLDPEMRLMQRLSRPPVSGVGQVVVLGIDDEDMKLIGHPPIHRRNYALLVDFLKKQGARAVAFDLFLDEPHDGDEDLRDSLEAFGPFALAGRMDGIRPPGEYPAVCGVTSSTDAGAWPREAAGIVNAYSRDPLVALPLMVETPDGNRPGLALLACLRFWGLSWDRALAVDPGRLRLDLPGGERRMVPMWGRAELLLRFQPPEGLHYLNVRRIVAAIKSGERIPWLAGALVFVGMHAQNQDLVTSAYGEQMYGVAALATASRQLLEGDFYRPLDPVRLAGWIIVLAGLALLVRFLPDLRWRGWALAALVVAAMGAGSLGILTGAQAGPMVREAAWAGLAASLAGIAWLARLGYLLAVPRLTGADFAARVLHRRRRVRDLLLVAGDRETDWLELKGMTEPSGTDEEQRNRERPLLHWEIAKAMIALANNRGGALVVGLDDKPPHAALDLAIHSDPGRYLRDNNRDAYWSSYLKKIFERRAWDYPEPGGRRRIQPSVHTPGYPPHFEWGFHEDGGATVLVLIVHPVPPGEEIIIHEGNSYKLLCRMEGDVGGTRVLTSPEEMEQWRKRRNPVSRKFNGLLTFHEKHLEGDG